MKKDSKFTVSMKCKWFKIQVKNSALFPYLRLRSFKVFIQSCFQRYLVLATVHALFGILKSYFAFLYSAFKSVQLCLEWLLNVLLMIACCEAY